MINIYLKVFSILSLFIASNSLLAQKTVGLFSNTADAYNGYTLFAPISSSTTYLIDNCGEKVHSWPSEYNPGLSAYLLENGNLLRTRNTNNNTFDAGGSGGGIEMLDWEGNVIWEYTISSTTECQHHDVEYLPNGNILVIVWDAKSKNEASQAGRTTSGVTLWSEKIIEIQPDLVNGGGTIVWEWKVWDHLVQDVDATKVNFGNVADSPQLLNINHVSGNPNNEDWLHLNAIDYNENLDQIILSSHSFNEVWIIDHSTTTEEAASHSGGDAGRGGDLLYRWGNPQAYNQGNNGDQKLFRQHDAHWIEDGSPDEGKIMIFNNQAGATTDYSEVNVIDPPMENDGTYALNGSTYFPVDFHWTYRSLSPTSFYASNISGAQRLPNGNTLICEGPAGKFFEVDYNGNKVWEYINPVGQQGIATQGNPANRNSVFRSYRYSSDYEGFAGQTLTPQGYIESGSTFDCELITSTIDEKKSIETWSVYPNPFYNQVTIAGDIEELKNLSIYNSLGQNVTAFANISMAQTDNITIDLSSLQPGIYVIKSGASANKILKL